MKLDHHHAENVSNAKLQRLVENVSNAKLQRLVHTSGQDDHQAIKIKKSSGPDLTT